MADKIVEELQRLTKDPEFMAGIEQVMLGVRETIDSLSEAGRIKPHHRDFVVTI